MPYSISGEIQNVNFLLNQYKDIIKNDGLYKDNVYGSYIHGIFDKEAQVEALTRAKNIALSQITEDTKKYIEDNYGDFNNWVTIQIEATIDLLKN